MTISVIIPSYNGAHKITGVLHSLINQTRKPDEVLLVVDGSTDDTVNVAETYQDKIPNLRIINQENKGRAGVRNRGAAEAIGDLLVYFDDDMLPEPDCISIYEELIQKNPDQILVGRTLEVNGHTIFQRFRKYLSVKWEKSQQIDQDIKNEKRVIFLAAANFCISKVKFNHLGGFDIRLYDAEDFDLAVRAFEQGIAIKFCHEALAYHNDPVTGKSYIKRLRQYRNAHKYLRELEPLRYVNIPLNQPVVPVGVKKYFFIFFANKFWINWLDNKSFKYLIPKPICYRIFDWIITSNGSYFPEKVKL